MQKNFHGRAINRSIGCFSPVKRKMQSLPKVSIIIPTLNEAETIGRCLKSISRLNYPKNRLETVIVDGNSTDRTGAIAKKYGCKILTTSKRGRAAACNVGLQKASGTVIAFTDADCEVTKNWLKELVPLLLDEKTASAGGPNIAPEGDGDFAKKVDAVLAFLSKPGARYGLRSQKPMETFHNSGCNAAYRKDAFKKTGLFNESLLTCEDEELDFRMKRAGYKIMFNPKAFVYHYRRPNWHRFTKQAYNYAYGRMQAIKLHPEMARWFHFAPLGLFAALAALLFASVFHSTALALFVLLSGTALLSVAIASIRLASGTVINFAGDYFLLISGWIAYWAAGTAAGLLSKKP